MRVLALNPHPDAEALVERVRGAEEAWVRTPPRCIPLGSGGVLDF